MTCVAPRVRVTPTVWALLLALWVAPALAAETPPAGATSCSGCHSPAKAAATGIPPIEGRDPAALQELLAGFRSGAVPATLMNRIMLGFSPEEIAALAKWFGRKS